MAQRKWEQSEAGKASRKRALKKYLQSEKGRERRRILSKAYYYRYQDKHLARRQKAVYGAIVPENAVCAICGGNRSQKRKIGMDHDHKTGKIREPLCVVCNSALGLFAENIDLLKNAISYIEKHSLKEVV